MIAAVLTTPHMTTAQTPAEQTYNIPEQDLGSALRAFAAASGREVVASSELLAGKRSGEAIGPLTPEEAVRHLLAGTDLSYRIVDGAFVIRPTVATSAEQKQSIGAAGIVVTGTRIQGAPIASPVINIDRESIRNSGQAELGDVVRSLPQSFGGGQNPGVGSNVPSTSGVNLGGGSSINLRGLGSDATLTLLNGRRLPYSASRQSVDVSAIPLAAVDRIEIMPDGASALYGSDAVAGVANIILRRDFQGLETTARLGTATAGGDFQQLYSALAGARWQGGALVAAYEFSRDTSIEAEDRDYAEMRRPGVTLFPYIRRHSATLTAHQDLTASLSLGLDALYNRRFSQQHFPLNAAGDLAISRQESIANAESFVVAPHAELALGENWRMSLSGSYGEDRVHFRGDSYFGTRLAASAGGCYCNRATALELGGEGALFDLPSGPVRIAAGIGFRRNAFELFRGAGNVQNAQHAQASDYAYGELSLPLVSPSQDLSWARRLDLSAAGRFEHYPGIGNVTTPKFGLIYAPIDGLDLKASWGRSFRAPTFLQQYQAQQVVLTDVSSVGGAGYPAGSAALLLGGGNSNLRPERARTWSATAALHPDWLSGARLEISYFSTDYTDRIVTPILFESQALRSAIYQQQVILNPSDAQKQAAIAAADIFTNALGASYDPAQVVAIIDNRSVNAGRQRIEGVDILFDWRHELGSDSGVLSATLNASYLTSDQRLTPAQPTQQLAGVLFNPPHFRARGMLDWQRGGLNLAATLSYIGGVKDTRSTPPVSVAGMTMLDLSARYRFDHPGLLRGLELQVAVQNLFDDKPDPIATTLFFDKPYDSTNYSPVGRFVSFTIRKTW
jgi:outer membrane receptor protein involved in Fe transport